MRICSKCKVEKSTSAFHKRGESYQTRCKVCLVEVARFDFQVNKERIYLQRRQRRIEFIAWTRSLKTGTCTDCKLSFHPVAMQWDHRPGEVKLMSVSALSDGRASKERILKEIEKCDLVCSNCHAIRTFNRRTNRV